MQEPNNPPRPPPLQVLQLSDTVEPLALLCLTDKQGSLLGKRKIGHFKCDRPATQYILMPYCMSACLCV